MEMKERGKVCFPISCAALHWGPQQGLWLLPTVAKEKQKHSPHTYLFHSSTRPCFAHHNPITQACEPDATEPQPKAAHLGFFLTMKFVSAACFSFGLKAQRWGYCLWYPSRIHFCTLCSPARPKPSPPEQHPLLCVHHAGDRT